ncbi:expressed unknown protein [Seminavis robusta]|uniref:Uncharacterized protein n=1 Tax=Seminavis robusta TaxID=568900 RepID=A0A9N8ECF1_9STRA|nr:expressed unknown protein [Seminavis robusta]|eukprot:Sro875_g214430.1 n/a (392) ;mRNA; f:35998-37173
MNWTKKIILMSLAMFGSLCARSVQNRIEKGVALQDSIPLYRFDAKAKATVTYVSILKSSSPTHVDLKAAALLKIVRRHHGQVGYLGKCFAVAVESKQFDSADCDLVLVTYWKRPHPLMSPSFGFSNFRSEIDQQKTWTVHQAQKMVDSGHSVKAVVMAMVVHGFLPFFMNIYAAITGFEYTFEPMSPVPIMDSISDNDSGSGGISRSTEEIAKTDDNNETDNDENKNENDNTEENKDNKSIHKQEEDEQECVVDPQAAKMQKMAKLMLLRNDEKEPEDEPAYVWNFVQKGTMSPEDEEKDRKYRHKFLQMIAYHDGGPMHTGLLEPADSSKDGSYAMLAAVYYPSRAFFSKLINSSWMYEAIQDKRPGDNSYCVVTVPMRQDKLWMKMAKN